MASENNNIESDKDGSKTTVVLQGKSDTGGLVMREEYHSPFGRTAKNACIEPDSLCLSFLSSLSTLFMPTLSHENSYYE